MKLLKTKLLFALASEVDFLKKSEGYEHKGYKFLYFRLSEFEKGSIRDAAVRLSREGLVDKITRNRQVYFRLTGAGRDKLLEKLDIYRGQRQVWDRIWRIVVLKDVEGKSRALQIKLSELGYKRVSRGVYVTPLRVSDGTKKLFLEKQWLGKAQVIESRRLIVGDDLQMARSLWHLEKVGGEYADFVTKSERLLKFSRRNIMLLQQSKGGFKKIFNLYFSLLMGDPGLPKKLLPVDWPAEKAGELFARLALLAKTANI